jgi:GT2 family glycosyltransferase
MNRETSVIVLNMNGGEMVLRCLESVASQDPPPERVIVVDNGSEDGSDDLVEERFPEVVLLRQGENTGFAAGNNAGLASAVGDLVVLVNNDCVAEPGWLESLRRTMSHGDTGAVTSSMRNIDDLSVMDSAGGAIDWLGFSWDMGKGHPATDFPERTEVAFPCGGAVMVRRSALPDPDRLFDERLFIYQEDLELGLQLNRLGHRVVYDPGAVIRHVHSATTGRGSYFKEYLCNRNRLLILRRQFHPEVFARMKPSLMGWQVIWMSASLARGRFTLWKALRNATRDGMRMPVEWQDLGRPVEEVFRDFAVLREGRPWPGFQNAARKAMGC